MAETALPFSVNSSIGKSVLIRGIGMHTMSVPLHKIRLNSDLVQGEVVVAVRPVLPVSVFDFFPFLLCSPILRHVRI